MNKTSSSLYNVETQHPAFEVLVKGSETVVLYKCQPDTGTSLILAKNLLELKRKQELKSNLHVHSTHVKNFDAFSKDGPNFDRVKKSQILAITI